VEDEADCSCRVGNAPGRGLLIRNGWHSMRFYDIFNGDADGLCALHQLRLAEPRTTTLVTGVKRDIALLAQVSPEAGDDLTVLDVSLDTNRAALLGALRIGARVRYFDHHFAGEIPHHHLLEAHIDPSPTMCTSLIVDRHLGGRYRAWAIVAAFGDNLRTQANEAAAALGLGHADIETLRELGECLNYNAYGRNLADLHFHPAQLYLHMRPYADPLAFCSQAAELDILRRASADDLHQALALPVRSPTNCHAGTSTGPWPCWCATEPAIRSACAHPKAVRQQCICWHSSSNRETAGRDPRASSSCRSPTLRGCWRC
jgi:hypothetical protein